MIILRVFLDHCFVRFWPSQSCRRISAGSLPVACLPTKLTLALCRLASRRLQGCTRCLTAWQASLEVRPRCRGSCAYGCADVLLSSCTVCCCGDHEGPPPALCLCVAAPPPSDIPMVLCVEAANVLDMGLEMFYPSADSRKELLGRLVSHGGVVEVNFLWSPPGESVRTRNVQCGTAAPLGLTCPALSCHVQSMAACGCACRPVVAVCGVQCFTAAFCHPVYCGGV